MRHGRIVVISGAPGTGKTTVASIIAAESDYKKSVHMRTDDYYRHISKGKIPKQLPEAYKQNAIVIEAFLEAAKCYARAGYDVVIDAVVGPLYLDCWLNAVRNGYEIHYFILRADKEETLKRALNRCLERNKPFDSEHIEIVWEQFHSLGSFEAHAISTTFLSPRETILIIQDAIRDKTYLLS